MPDLSYSDDALNIRGAFFGAKTVVYVEGDDDVLFWQAIFAQVADQNFEIESVGGSPTLDEYIQKISSGKLVAIAARDSDFLSLLGTKSQDPKVVYTTGYSIENSLYVPEALTNMARAWCKSNQISGASCEAWLKEFATAVAPLVYLDLANTTASAGVQTIGDNCDRFMTSKNSATVCNNKVNDLVVASLPKLPAAHVGAARLTVGAEPEIILTNIRGHFLASAIHRFITKEAKSLGRKVSISAESLYAAALGQFSASLRNNHPHRDHYLDAAKLAWQSV